MTPKPLTRRQNAIVDAVRKLQELRQRSGANQIAAAIGAKRDAVRRECGSLVAAGVLDVVDRGTQQAGCDYVLPVAP